MGRRRQIPPVAVPMGMKFCFQCTTPKPIASFATDAKTWDHLRPMCRDCDNARRLAYHAERRKRWLDVKARTETAVLSPVTASSPHRDNARFDHVRRAQRNARLAAGSPC